jgi:hypothetical protein
MEKQAGQNSVLSAIRFADCSCVGKPEGRGRSQERTIKRWFGYTHFLLKGLVKVRTEWSLTTLAYNLKQVLNLVSFEKLMSILRKTASEDRPAVGVKVPQRA